MEHVIVNQKTPFATRLPSDAHHVLVTVTGMEPSVQFHVCLGNIQQRIIVTDAHQVVKSVGGLISAQYAMRIVIWKMVNVTVRISIGIPKAFAKNVLAIWLLSKIHVF